MLNRLWTIALVIGLFFSPLAPAAEEPVVLSGTYTSLTRAMQNLIHGMSKAEPAFSAEQVNVRFEVLDVGRLPLPANAVENYLDLTTPEEVFEEQRIRLEGMIGRRVQVVTRRVSAARIAALEQEFNKAADTLWPVYQKVLAEAPAVSETAEPKFYSPWTVMWNSITNKGNLQKAVLRFALNTTLVGFSLYSMENMTASQSAILATAGGGGSFLLMAGNDLYKSWLASPFWTKFPSPSYVKQLYLEQDGSHKMRAAKALGLGIIKDAFVITGYVGVIMGVSYAVGVGPETVSEAASTFLKTLGLSAWTETSFNLMNAGLTAKALDNIPADAPDRAERIRKIRSRSATAALIQSPIVTVLQILASVGSVAGQTALLGLGGVGALGYFTLVLAPHDSKIGRVREKYIMPFLKDPLARARSAYHSTRKVVGRGISACRRMFGRLGGGRGGSPPGGPPQPAD